jgi:hypothetical protein
VAIDQLASWNKRALSARFAALRVRVANGPPRRIRAMGAQRLTAVAVERRQCVPELARLLRQRRRPCLCRSLTVLAKAVSFRPGACVPNATLLISMSAGVEREAVEQLEADEV